MRRSLNSIGFLDSQIESYQTGFKSLHNARVWLNDEIILEMKNGEPIENLKSLAQDFLIKKRDKYGVTVLKSTNRSIDAADVANKIYESGLVEYCHPNFVMEVVPENDPLYPDQYYLNNIGQIIDGSAGQSNIDVNGPEGWAVQVASPSIKVAVIDEGVEDHNDLRDANGNSRVLSGYTIGSPNGNGRPQFINRTHGQACAGILAASHNSIAIRGVAPNVQIVPVNISTPQGNADTFVDAYRWAWETAQVDIMSNSYNMPENDAVTTEIGRVRTLGRGGKGCLFVKSAGNTGGAVTYPGYVSGVIAVAAVNKSGQLSSYSARGTDVDIAAPSSEVNPIGDVRTLTLSNGTMSNFAGTSAACPQVSGIAALILSINPALTESAVSSLITSTARSIGISGIGSGLANSYAAVKRTLELYGGTISGVGNLPNFETWSMQPNVAITVAQGTSINTTGLVFQRATSSNWGGIYINSNNSTFNSCQFLNGSGGGNYMVFVRGYDVFFNNCTFNGATDAGTGRGISTDFTPSGQRSRLHLTNCTFQNNRTGVVLANCDAFLNNCTIQNNTSVGLYQLNAVNVMWNSEIMNNVTNLASEGERAGIENLSSTLSMAAYSYNTVKNNLSHEIINSSNSFLYAGTPSPSLNSIYDTQADYASAGRKYIINQNSSFTVQARTNYWGGEPVPEMFSGAVDYSNWLTYNPTGFSAPPDNLVMQQNNDSPTSTFNGSVDDKTDEVESRRERMVALLGQLRQTPDDPQTYRRIAELHGLALLDKDDKTGQRAAVFQALSDWENRTVAFRQANADAALRQTHPTQRAGEQATLAMLNLLIKQDRYDEARQRLAQAKFIVERKESQLALLMSEATLEEQAGRFQNALARVQSVRQLATEISGDKTNRYDIVEQNLRRKLGDASPEQGSATVALSSFSSDVAKASSVELLQNYPNPFNPSTVIAYQLPVSSQVSLKIYDMLGREVQTLVNETQAAGRYAVRFNATNLSSGTYFYKLQANGLVQTKKLTLLK